MLYPTKKISRISVFVLLIILFSLLIALDSFGRKSTEGESSEWLEARKIATTNSQAFYGPSVEMRENVDFLLTPAIMVQQAIDPESIITYPNE